jgi:transcriptional regulator with XRE-family HTH domain
LTYKFISCKLETETEQFNVPVRILRLLYFLLRFLSRIFRTKKNDVLKSQQEKGWNGVMSENGAKAKLLEIGWRVKKAREAMGLTQEQFADKYGYPRTTLAKLESGHRDFKSTEIVTLAEQLNVSCDYLLGRSRAAAPDDLYQEAVKRFGLAEETLQALELIRRGADFGVERDKIVKRPHTGGLPELQLSTLDHLIVNLSETIIQIGLFLFTEISDFTEVPLMAKGLNIKVGYTRKMLRDGLLANIQTALSSYQTALETAGGDLPLTGGLSSNGTYLCLDGMQDVLTEAERERFLELARQYLGVSLESVTRLLYGEEQLDNTFTDTENPEKDN